ncbi:hypothetical protein [Kribbella sp. C-35]|uniref:hypothetical protein n=1 Tax=Kribbella sp. C-35 TaxID=2789276 RepID=UPI00397C6ACB
MVSPYARHRGLAGLVFRTRAARLGTLHELTKLVPIIADALGYHPSTIERHAIGSASVYCQYIAARRPDGLIARRRCLHIERSIMPMCGRVDKPWKDLGLIATMAQVFVGRKGRLPKIRQGACDS